VLLWGCQSAPKSPLLNRLTKTKPREEVNIPPRRAGFEEEVDRPVAKNRNPIVDDSDISLTEFSTEGGKGGIELSGATVVARVNSVPIFAEDVLEPWAPQLEKAAQQLNPEELNRLKAKVIRDGLPRHIEKAVLVSAVRESTKREDLDKIDVQLEKMWKERELPRLREIYKVDTTVEVERMLQEHGSTLSNVKHQFMSRELAMYYIGLKTKGATEKYGPRELRAYYDEHRDEFKILPKAKWQQIQVSFRSNGGKDAALLKLKRAIQELKDGADYGDVAKRVSDGPNAAEGGVWDWTSEGSLASKKLNKALFELPVGRISSPIETNDAWVLVKVLDRQGGGYRPYEEVQDDLKKRLTGTAHKDAAERTIKELTEAATIWTIFDKENS